MTQLEPVYGYDHSLTIDEIVSTMIDFDLYNNELPFKQVLDCWVDQAEQAWERGRHAGAPKEELDDLEHEVNRRKTRRGGVKAMYVELNTAAAEIAQGNEHPYLVLFNPRYAPGEPEFTIKSLYVWARESSGKVVSEWTSEEQLAPNSLQLEEYVPTTAAKGCLYTAFLIAEALTLLVDKLVENGHIEHPTNTQCMNENGCLDLAATAEYIALSPLAQISPGQNTPPPEDRPITQIEDVDLVSLGQVAHAFCSLAEQARLNEWVTFRDWQESVIRAPFHKGGKYVSLKIYDYLLKKRTITSIQPNQGKSSINHRLGSAKKAFYNGSAHRLSALNLQKLLQLGQDICSENA